MLNHKRHPKPALTPNPAETWCPSILIWQSPVTLKPNLITIKAASLQVAIADPLGPEADVGTLIVPKTTSGRGMWESLIGNLPFYYGNNLSFSQWYFFLISNFSIWHFHSKFLLFIEYIFTCLKFWKNICFLPF